MPEKNTDLVNERVRFSEVLLIGPQGEQLGVMSSKEAYYKAMSYNLDLLCVAPGGKPPVCKILDYGKHRFETQKKNRESKRTQALRVVELKEVQLTPQIGENDLNTKAKHAKKFLLEGDKVKVRVRYRGRQLAHIEVGEEVINKFIALVEEYSTIEKPPQMEGRWLNAILASKIKKTGGKINAKNEE